jgi:hypothetical protein
MFEHKKFDPERTDRSGKPGPESTPMPDLEIVAVYTFPEAVAATGLPFRFEGTLSEALEARRKTIENYSQTIHETNRRRDEEIEKIERRVRDEVKVVHERTSPYEEAYQDTNYDDSVDIGHRKSEMGTTTGGLEAHIGGVVVDLASRAEGTQSVDEDKVA